MTTARIIRFPRAAVVWLLQASEGGWLVLAPRGNGWLHGDRRSALADARWLSSNLGGLPIREPSP